MKKTDLKRSEKEAKETFVRPQYEWLLKAKVKQKSVSF